MKVMLLTETLAPGGAETFVVRLANALAARHEVVVVAMHAELVHPAVLKRISDQVVFEPIRLPAKSLLWKVSSLLRKLKVDWSPIHHLIRARVGRLVERYAPDVIHSHLFHADHCASEVSKKAGYSLSHVMTVHGDYAPYSHGEADPQILDFETKVSQIVEHASAIVGVSQEHVEFFAARFPATRPRLHVIYNGYSTFIADDEQQVTANPILPDRTFLFGMVARGVDQKGWAEAVAAFEMLNWPDAALVLVGEGPAIERLRRRTKSGNVIFAGFSDEPLEFIRRFDVCLLPTSFPHESLPTVVTEYLACSKPVIATDVGEIRNMLSTPDGRLAGLLLDFTGEAVVIGELASHMATLLMDSDLRAEFARRASQAFEKFRMEDCLRKYVRLYDHATGRRSRSASSAFSS